MYEKEGCQGTLEAVTISVIYLAGKFYFYHARESEKKNSLFWPSSVVSNSNPCIVGKQSFIFLAVTQFNFFPSL